MKTTSLIVGLSLALAAAGAHADDQTKDGKKTKAAVTQKQNKTKLHSPGKESEVLLTGSYLKQKIHRTDRITDGANQVVVIDRARIERSGASDLRQVLAQEGVR